jgi:small conductance mechanosensitive channel
MIDPLIIIVLEIVGTVAGSWAFAEVLIWLITRGMRRAHAPQGLTRSVREGLTILWVVLAIVAVLSITGLTSLFSFLTISGIVGLALSLALQSTLSNMISGLLLLSDGVLRLNDSISLSGVKGVVVRIGLRSTWVRTEAGEIAIMSNSNLASGPFVNYTAGKRLEKKLRL